MGEKPERLDTTTGERKMNNLLGSAIVLSIGVVIGSALMLADVRSEPQYATNLSKYTIEFERCMSLSSADSKVCDDHALWMAKTFQGGE